MREGPKPHELLSSKEKKAFELCSEILLWSNDRHILTWPGVLQLREDATKLYERISNMDIEHDDKYYQLYAEIEHLAKQYEQLCLEMKNRRWIQKEFEPDKDDVDRLIGIFREHIRRESSARLTLFHYNHSHGYGDKIELSIVEEVKMKGTYIVDIEEIFDYVNYEQSYLDALDEALEKRFGKKIKEMATVGQHLHDFSGGEQYSTIFRGVTPEEVEAIARDVFQIVKKHPRILKERK